MVMPAPFWDHPFLVKLLNLPGVYTFDYDASVQASVRHRIWVICNRPFMAYACGEAVRSLLPPERWAVLFTDFLIALFAREISEGIRGGNRRLLRPLCWWQRFGCEGRWPHGVWQA